MAYTVTIEYRGIEKEPAKIVAPVCRIFRPDSSYIDSPAYVNGITDADGNEVCGKSVYATNVDGWGKIDVLEPFATTAIPFPVPLAQFKLAVVGENNKVEFEVDDYKEAFYYMQVGEAIKDQGFDVTVVKHGAVPAPDPVNPENPTA